MVPFPGRRLLFFSVFFIILSAPCFIVKHIISCVASGSLPPKPKNFKAYFSFQLQTPIHGSVFLSLSPYNLQIENHLSQSSYPTKPVWRLSALNPFSFHSRARIPKMKIVWSPSFGTQGRDAVRSYDKAVTGLWRSCPRSQFANIPPGFTNGRDALPGLWKEQKGGASHPLARLAPGCAAFI